MAEQTFRSPGFFEREIDASTRQTEITGVPAGIIGTAEKGPAFVPVTVGSLTDFLNRFGDIDPDRFGPYAVQAFLQNRTAATYMRVLGAGSNETTTNITNTQTYGTVVNAGFKLSGSISGSPSNNATGMVQFLVADHTIDSQETLGMPEFTDNPSWDASNSAKIVRGVIFNAVGSRIQVLDLGQTWTSTLEDVCAPDASGLFGLAISSSLGTNFSPTPATNITTGFAGGVKIVTASLDPSNSSYIANVLNTDPTKFHLEQHLLYLDFAVANENAAVVASTNSVAILSGSQNAGTALAATEDDGAGYFTTLFGRFDTRFTTPSSPSIISQPFGGTEYDLFRFESLSDGSYGNDKVKVSIANLRASTNLNYQYGTFEVQVRRFDDTDLAPQIVESYPGCTLDPTSESFIGRKIGDYKVWYNFDAENDEERRLIVGGKYPNQSVYVRVVIEDALYRGEIPTTALPFGFAGIPAIKTTNSLTDDSTKVLTVDGVTYGNVPETLAADGTADRLYGNLPAGAAMVLTGSIVPPLPMRFKVTRGAVSTSPFFSGWPGDDERVDGRFYWGVKFERCPREADLTGAVLNQNISSLPNTTVSAYTKYQGIAKLDTQITGSAKNMFNMNKFTLARVALSQTGSNMANLLANITGSAKEHMLDACYVRNGVPDSQTYAVADPDNGIGRVTFASLVQSSSIKFNRFTSYLKFTTPLFGGFDGLNILDKDMSLMNDRATSTDASGETGKASSEFSAASIGLSSNPAGSGRLNNNINAYRTAARIMTDPMTVRNNILTVPGIRDSYVTDWAANRVRDYSMAIYLMDIPSWSESAGRLFGDENRSLIVSASTSFPDVRETAEQFESRAIDNNYCATYFPDVYIKDSNTGEAVLVPSSVAALAALGYNDKVAYPWFAPAGFNRGGLDMVTNTDARLTASDRDDLYDVRINPIANFPNGGFVIFGQKTMQLTQSALDRVNVRRMMLELKRQVVTVANSILFEPNNAATRARFVNLVTPQLAAIQAQQGIELFKVVMDDTNNSQEDVESNKLNGRIVVVPTRAIEFIAIDFIITNSGVDFA